MINQFIKKYFWAFTLAGLLVLAGLLAKGAGDLVMASLRTDDAVIEAELAAVTSSRQGRALGNAAEDIKKRRARDGITIMRRNIFDSTVGSVYPGDQPDEETISVDAGMGEEGVLNLSPCDSVNSQVVATVVSTDPEWSFATIKNASETMLYREGMMVDGNVITKISWRYLFFRQLSGECYVDLWAAQNQKDSRANRRGARMPRPWEPQAKAEEGKIDGIQVVSDTKRIINRSVIDDAIANQEDMLKSARVIPYEKDGKVEGFKVYGIRGGGLLGQLGLKNGDIIQTINGTQITSADQALAAYGKFKSASNLKVDITRRGSPMTLDVDIK